MPRAAATVRWYWVGHSRIVAMSSSTPRSLPRTRSMIDGAGSEWRLSPLQRLQGLNKIGEAVDPEQHVVDGVVAFERRVAVEAACTKRILEGFAHRSQGNSFATEEVAGDVRDVLLQERIHPANVLDPHDVQRRFEQPGESGETCRHAGLEHDGISSITQRATRDVVVEERVVIAETVARRRTWAVSYTH